MDFFLFILVNATLFIRPGEIVPSLMGLPIYNALISTCLLVSFGSIFAQLRGRKLQDAPLTVCVLGLLLAVVLSHLAHAQSRLALASGIEFAKIVIYYLLLVTVVNSEDRLSRFLTWLGVATILLTLIALGRYYDIVDVPSFEVLQRREIDQETGTVVILPQLQSSGIFNDPNDLCLILLVGMGICAYRMGGRRALLYRALWSAPLCVFMHSLILTQSRGGFLALLAALAVLFQARFGWSRAIPLAALALPAAVVLSAGRQTNLDTNEASAQSRIQLWAEGLAMLRQDPLFGIGQGLYADFAGLVAHNSFVHAFAELGVFGGVLFQGAYFYSLVTLYSLKIRPDAPLDPEIVRLRPYLLAIVAAYATGLLTLTRNYTVPTYMVFGLVTAYLQLVSPSCTPPVPRFNYVLLGRFAAVSIAFLVAVKIFVMLFARWG